MRKTWAKKKVADGSTSKGLLRGEIFVVTDRYNW